MSGYVAHLNVLLRDGGPYWTAVIGKPGSEYLARIDAICWRKFKSRKTARIAGRQALKRMFGEIEIRESEYE